MRTFAQKKTDLRTKSASFTTPGRLHRGQSREGQSTLYLRTIGNQAAQRLLQANGEECEGSSFTSASPHFAHDFSWMPVHAKLKINASGDKYEQEAERVADQVIHMPETSVNLTKPVNTLPASIESECGDKIVRAKQKPSNGRAPPASSQIAISSLTGGKPLPISEREYFEPRFGRSFKNVRIHSGVDANAAAMSINARAFTLGNDIAFAQGQYRPGTEDGRHLLAHELTHTLQQDSRQVSANIVQADFWDTLGQGWELYWDLDDEGAPFAQQLMEHYLLGFGTDFDVYSGTDPNWNQFMLGRPEIQRAMRPVLEGIATRVASAGQTDQPWFRWGAGPTVNETLTGVKLNELESMRLTLHGCHRIEVEVNYDVNSIVGGEEVIFRRISMKWIDVADLHPGTVTVLDSGEEVDDAELTSAGLSYNVYIEFDPAQHPVHERTVYHVSGGSVTYVSGWPPPPGAASPGRRS